MIETGPTFRSSLTTDLRKITYFSSVVVVYRSVVWRKHGRLYGGTTHRRPSATKKPSNLFTTACMKAQVLDPHIHVFIFLS